MYRLATKSSVKTNRQNYFTMSKCHDVQTKVIPSNSCVYKRCKQTVTSPIGLHSDSYALVVVIVSLLSMLSHVFLINSRVEIVWSVSF